MKNLTNYLNSVNEGITETDDFINLKSIVSTCDIPATKYGMGFIHNKPSRGTDDVNVVDVVCCNNINEVGVISVYDDKETVKKRKKFLKELEKLGTYEYLIDDEDEFGGNGDVWFKIW